MYMNQNNISPIRSVGLIGAGIMGQGIAQLAAQAGARVLLQVPVPVLPHKRNNSCLGCGTRCKRNKK